MRAGPAETSTTGKALLRGCGDWGFRAPAAADSTKFQAPAAAAPSTSTKKTRQRQVSSLTREGARASRRGAASPPGSGAQVAARSGNSGVGRRAG